MSDLIKRSDAIEAVEECLKLLARPRYTVKTAIEAIPSVDIPHSDDWEKYSDRLWKNAYERGKADRPQGEWIPCSERLPEDLEIVNITWVNHRPTAYYADIKDKPFAATAIRYKDKWWWYSPICEDLLAEYGKSECDKMDADIEVLAWMPLPKPWKGTGDED